MRADPGRHHVDGKTIKAIAQPTKQGWSTCSIASTGQPVWPIEERPVEKGDVPGEWYSPTQPFVTKPPAFERQGVTEDDLIDFTPELRAEAREAVVANYKIGPIFTPPVVSKWQGPLGTLILPVVTGGANWQGGSFDPETNIFYIFSNSGDASLGSCRRTAADPTWTTSGHGANPNAAPARRRGGAGGAGARGGGGGRAARRRRRRRRRRSDRSGAAAHQAAVRTITALDLNKGELVWQIAHGETPDNIKNNPALKGLTIPRTGRQGRIGVLTTKTLVIAGEGGFVTTPNGSAARCCAPTTRRRARKSARSTCRRRRPDRR